MHVMFVLAIVVICGIAGFLFIGRSLDGYGERWQFKVGIFLTSIAVCMLGWFLFSMSQPTRISKQYKIPVTKVPLPDGSFKQVFAYNGSDSGVTDVYSQFHMILPDIAEIQVTEYDLDSYAGISYNGMISKKYEPYIPR
jgi:hypothetical protein